MSTCTRFPDDAQVLRYVTSDLAEPERSAFEDHLFACDACLARVERYQAAQASLASRDVPAGPIGVVLPMDEASALDRRLPLWLGAVAALLVVGAVGVLMTRPTPAPAPPRASLTPDVPSGTDAVAPPAPRRGGDALGLAVLALVTPPPYLPVTTRGAAAPPFAAAMDAYIRKDWAAASRGLASVETPEAHFYRGVADLMRGDAAGATHALEAARDSGRQPYARESAFYLGKAGLLRGDLAAARARFDEAAASGATTAREAARLRDALDERR